jgi:hypothetical protein
MPRATRRPTLGNRRPIRGEMVLQHREVLVEATRVLVDEVRPTWAGPVIVTVALTPVPKVAVTYPSQRA